MRKRVAVLAGQPEEYLQALFIKGLSETLLEKDFDVCVFAMYQKFQNSPDRAKGESSIYDLVDYKAFDAICIMGDSIQTPGVLENLIKNINEKFSGTVVIAEKDVPGYAHVLQDNYSPEKKIIEHMIEHGYKDIAFLTGKSWHPHSKIRLKAFLDTMAEHGLEVGENRVFYGDFWYSSGELTAKRLMDSGKLPEAVACANDCMAIGLAKAFTNAGIRIPEDVAIAGYDCSEEGRRAPVSITSVHMPQEEFGKHAADAILALMEGKEIPEYRPDAKLFIGKSCGCQDDKLSHVVEVRNSWETEISGGSVKSIFNEFYEDIMSVTSPIEFINTVYANLTDADNFDGFKLCLNDGFEFRENSFSTRMIAAVSTGDEDGDRIGLDNYFIKEEMLPGFKDGWKMPSLVYFLPLRYGSKNFGFTALISRGRYEPVKEGYRIWARLVMCAGEVLIQRMQNSLSGTMGQGTGLDSLTGLPDYTALLNQSEDILKYIAAGGGKAYAAAFEIRNLSAINEQQGRSVGSNVIKNVSAIMLQVFAEAAAYIFYTGNGEFVVVMSGVDGREFEGMCADVIERAEGIRAGAGKDKVVEVCNSIESGSPTDGESLERLINVAISRKNGLIFSLYNAPKGGHSLSEDMKLTGRVRELLDHNRFDYHFQPIVKVEDGSVFAYEALMRPKADPYIAPPEVIRCAKFLGRLHDVEKITFFNVLERVNKEQLFADSGRKVFINSIPGQELTMDELKPVETVFRETGGRMVVELTEQAELSDEELEKLRAFYAKIGAQSAVDDYGTGYSNITNLLRYMPDYVKIDRALISGIENSSQKKHFVREIITFSHENGIKALAEGVETSEELKEVIMLGVDLIQGFYTAKPSYEFIDEIDRSIREEVITYYNARNGIYVPGREARVILTKLKSEGVKHIHVMRKEMTFIDFTIVGLPEVLHRGPDMVISNGYHGSITIDNCVFGGGDGFSVRIENGCTVNFIKKGHNVFYGPIKLEGDASYTIEGDGTVEIRE